MKYEHAATSKLPSRFQEQEYDAIMANQER